MSESEGIEPGERASLVVNADQAGRRLDVVLAEIFQEVSRVAIRNAIAAGTVTVDGQRRKVAYRLLVGQRIEMTLPEAPPPGPIAEQIPLTLLFEDDQLAVVNKDPGMVVHPAKGHWSGTLTSGLAHHFQSLSSVGGPTRPGIVHRLDRDTSGVIVIAKTDRAHRGLAAQFANRSVEKEYWAITLRTPDRDRDQIDAPIGPHPSRREKMAILADHARSRTAQTTYEVLERFRGFAFVRCFPKTGRTHQIRLHLSSISCPVLCDRLYGGRSRLLRGELSGNPAEQDVVLDRQALHARQLTFVHPITEDPMSIVAPLADDLQETLDALREFRSV